MSPWRWSASEPALFEWVHRELGYSGETSHFHAQLVGNPSPSGGDPGLCGLCIRKRKTILPIGFGENGVRAMASSPLGWHRRKQRCSREGKSTDNPRSRPRVDATGQLENRGRRQAFNASVYCHLAGTGVST